MATLTKLKLAVKTGFGAFAGTDARIYLILCTPRGSRTYLLPTQPSDMETGRTDIYELSVPEGPDLEELQQAILVNGMNGRHPAWRLLWIKLDAVDARGQSWRLVDDLSERWLDTQEARAPAYVLPLKRPFESLGSQDVVGATPEALQLIC
jgi:hypothetical protein